MKFDSIVKAAQNRISNEYCRFVQQNKISYICARLDPMVLLTTAPANTVITKIGLTLIRSETVLISHHYKRGRRA